MVVFFFFQAEDGIRDGRVTGVQTCALPISNGDENRRHQIVTLRYALRSAPAGIGYTWSPRLPLSRPSSRWAPGLAPSSASHTRRSGPSEVARPASSNCREPSAARTIRAVPVVGWSCETNDADARTAGPAGAGAGAEADGEAVAEAEGTGADSVSCTVLSVSSFHGA